jgi:flagellar motor switch protein FliG
MAAPHPEKAPSGLRKAAILLVLLGDDVASRVYRILPAESVERLTQEIAGMGNVAPVLGLQVLEEYHGLTLTQEARAEGGSAYAKDLLIKAFGEQEVMQFLEQISRAEAESNSQLDSLRKADPVQLAKFLEVEHPQTIALTMAHLDVKHASSMLMRLPEAVRAEAIKRLARLRPFPPEMAERVSLMLHKRMESLGDQSRRAYAGLKGVADVLNRLDPAEGKAILESIEKEDAKLAISIRNLMFTFEDLLGVPEPGIREILGALDKKNLALALRGASEELRNYIFRTMSTRAVQMLKEDMEVLGPLRSREVAQAQQEILNLARRLEAEGKVILKLETGDEMMA